MTKKIIAIGFIYICTAAAWMILSSTTSSRTYEYNSSLHQEVGQIWGDALRQKAPQAFVITDKTLEFHKMEKTPIKNEQGWTIEEQAVVTKKVIGQEETPVRIDSSKIDVDLQLSQRKKGLIWYSTYVVKFDAQYTIKNTTDAEHAYAMKFCFPASDVLDNFEFAVNGEQDPDLMIEDGVAQRKTPLKPGETATFDISYGSRGLDEWWYLFGDNVQQVNDFTMSMTTDFDDINFPAGGVSPTQKTKTASGWKLKWKYQNLMTGADLAMEMPHRLNPGPWISSVTLAAPISLFLFFFLLFIVTTLKQINIHPMNYFFIAAAFFSFHLLMAYMADRVNIHVAFAISSLVSVFLVISYMRLVTGMRFAFGAVGASQFVYQTLFSYTFFFEGYTGLAITVLCIITLFIVMQLTGRVDWDSIFTSAKTPTTALTTPAPPDRPDEKTEESFDFTT